jgi:anthranilate synthase component 1
MKTLDKTYPITTRHKKLLADTLTPVSIYLKLRDRFVNTILLESSDYHGNENSFTYICCDPIASFKLNNSTVTQKFPDGSEDQFRP